MGSFEDNINRLVDLSDELRELVKEAHAALKDLRQERKEIEKLLGADVQKMVHDRTDEVVKTELDKIAPTIRKQTSLIYDRVGNQIDSLINLMLGKEFQTGKHGDLRPALAEKMRVWLRELVDDEEN